MIRIPAAELAKIERAAAAAYPVESCGLLVGRDRPDGTVAVSRAIESANLRAAERTDRFEVDPKVRFDVMRALEGTDERIVGHYHSHPDHPAEPSDADLRNAWEPELIWLITAVENGRPGPTTAHVLNDARTGFRALSLKADAD
jgi:proteasome lid subunit RPN8/RPN11